MNVCKMVCLTVLLAVSSAFGQQWQQGFEQDLGGAESYHKAPDDVTLELGTENPAEGNQFIRCILTGERTLEGFRVSATGLTGARVATVTAQVRGSGEIWLCLNSRNGWLYAPQTVTLTDQWQEISLSKVLVAEDTGVNINFLSRDVQTDAVFEVDDIRVTLAEPLRVYEASVGPWSLEAEDYFLSAGVAVVDDPEASGGKALRAGRYFTQRGFPFPRTANPVTVWLRVKSGTGNETFELQTYLAGNRETVRTAKPTRAGSWEWLPFSPVLAGEIGDTFGLAHRPAEGQAGVTYLDRVVIATGELTEAQLDAAPPLYARRPMAQVARCSTPPQIDGRPDDEIWQNAVALTDFVEVRSMAPAEAQTTVKLCYDDQYLYVLLHCEEPILGVALQKRHEFLANTLAGAEGEQANIYRDDSLMVLLDPGNTGQQAYEFGVNALGMLADAFCPRPDLWENRDTSWSSGTRVAGDIGDGEYTVEMAIPFANLGGTPQVGDVWRAVAGRIAKARNETTSWNPTPFGFHDGPNMGSIVFAGPLPGVTLNAPAALQPGANHLTAALTPPLQGQGGVYLTSAVRSPQSGNNHFYSFTEFADAPGTVSHEFRVEEEGDLQVAHAVLDAASLQPLYLTPAMTRSLRSSVGTITLSCDGPFEAYLDGELLRRGDSADNLEIAAPLRKGPNVFALKLEQGTAAVTITPPGMPVEPGAWKLAPEDAETPLLPSVDDSGWETAPQVGQDPALGPIFGSQGRPTVLRHTLLWEKTRQWPTPDPALYIARGSNQHLTFICDGLPGKRLLDWTVYLAVPPQFEILGSSGYYGNVDYMPHFECTQLGEQEISGQTMRVAKVVATKPVMSGRHYIMSLFNAMVRCAADEDAFEGGETSFIFWAEANDRTVVEPPQVIPVRLLPPLNGKQPSKLVWQLWPSFFSNVTDLDVREQMAETIRDAGVNDIVNGGVWATENAERFGFKHTVTTNFHAAMNLRPYLEEHPDRRLIDMDGEPDNHSICMTLLLGDSWVAAEREIASLIERLSPDTVDYDYEYGPFKGSPHSCFCPRCLAVFREFAELPADTPLDPQCIQQDHGDAWVDFMAWRVAEIFLKFKETVHRLSPGTKFSAYSGYQTPENPWQYGVNWAYVGELQAVDHAGFGYGRSPYIKETIEALKGIPAIFGEIITPYSTSNTMPPRPLVKANLLRRVIDATGGVLLYDRLPMDGRTWFASAEITRLIADYEDAFLHGEANALGNHDRAAVEVITHENLTLVCVMNASSQEAQWSLALPAGAGTGEEYYSGARVAGGETVTCTLQPGDAAAYILRR